MYEQWKSLKPPWKRSFFCNHYFFINRLIFATGGSVVLMRCFVFFYSPALQLSEKLCKLSLHYIYNLTWKALPQTVWKRASAFKKCLSDDWTMLISIQHRRTLTNQINSRRALPADVFGELSFYQSQSEEERKRLFHSVPFSTRQGADALF